MKPNLSRLTTILEKPKPPTIADALRGSGEAPLSDAQRSGYRAETTLATREADRLEHAAHARERLEAAQRAAEDAVWARIEARRAGR